MDVTMAARRNDNILENARYQSYVPHVPVKPADMEYVKKLLRETKGDVNLYLDEDVLMNTAIRRNDIEMVKLLLQHNASPNLPAEMFSTIHSPLWVAIFKHRYEIVELLILAGARLCEFICTPEGDLEQFLYLHQAIMRGDVKMMELLLSHNADVNARGALNMSALHLAMCAKCPPSVLKMLLNHGANPNVVDDGSISVLHLAMLKGYDAEIVGLLLDKGADVNDKSEFNETPLHFAVQLNCSFTIVQVLLSKGANANEKTVEGQTALHYACQKGSVEKIHILLENKANITIQDVEGHTPFQLISKKNSRAVKMMVKQMVKEIEFSRIVAEKDMTAIRAEENLRAFHDQCIEEIWHMKNQKIYNWISFYHIFSKDETKVAPLLRNKEFVQAYISIDTRSIYPAYCIDLGCKMRKAESIIKPQLKMEKYLHVALSTTLPALVINRIAYFSNPNDFPIVD